MSAAQDRFDTLAEGLLAGERDVSIGRAFRDGVLKVRNADGKPRIFAMPDDGGIVLKLRRSGTASSPRRWTRRPSAAAGKGRRCASG